MTAAWAAAASRSTVVPPPRRRATPCAQLVPFKEDPPGFVDRGRVLPPAVDVVLDQVQVPPVRDRCAFQISKSPRTIGRKRPAGREAVACPDDRRSRARRPPRATIPIVYHTQIRALVISAGAFRSSKSGASHGIQGPTLRDRSSFSIVPSVIPDRSATICGPIAGHRRPRGICPPVCTR